MNSQNEQDIKARRRNLIVSINGLRDPYLPGQDNTETRWTIQDVGKLYAYKCITLPLELRSRETYTLFTGVQAERRRAETQEYFRVEFYNTLVGIEFFRKPRETAVKEFVGPYKIIETTEDEARQTLRKIPEQYPTVSIDEIIQATLMLTTKEQNPELMEAIGNAVRTGAEEYVTLKKANDIGKRMYWKPHREFDLIIYHLITGLTTAGFIEVDAGLQGAMLEELAKDRYRVDDEKRYANGR